MDRWNELEINLMKLGGNNRLKKFLSELNIYRNVNKRKLYNSKIMNYYRKMVNIKLINYI
jgi:hypothetical protein